MICHVTMFGLAPESDCLKIAKGLQLASLRTGDLSGSSASTVLQPTAFPTSS